MLLICRLWKVSVENCFFVNCSKMPLKIIPPLSFFVLSERRWLPDGLVSPAPKIALEVFRWKLQSIY
ncbi:MAG: hypothetical protein C5B47_03825 [Verrucomicrobia bacterium]|nr:MAG: hypothetical protein C5B47_03825 [Verrucomicrobiota bacterium]